MNRAEIVGVDATDLASIKGPVVDAIRQASSSPLPKMQLGLGVERLISSHQQGHGIS